MSNNGENMSNTEYDCLIIGAGISGVSFAHYLHQQGKKVLVLEKLDKTGGQIQSPTTQTDSAYWRELGAHTCYNSYTHLLSIVKNLDCHEHVQALAKGNYVIFANGKIKSAMTQIAYPSLMLNGLKVFFAKRDGKTVKEYFENIVGKKNYKHLFSRLFRAVISQNADCYPAESFLKRRDGRYKDFPRKYTFSKGLNTIIELMIEKNKLEVATSCEVLGVETNSETNQYEVSTIDGKTYKAANIAFATDPQTTSRLLADMEADLASALGSIPMFHSESMNVVVAKEKLSVKIVAGIIPVSDEFHSAVSRDLVEDEKLRSFTFHFPREDKNKEQKMELICKVLNITKNDILEIEEDKHILPSLRMQHINMAEQVAEDKNRDSIYILGNYFYGLSLEDCVNRSADEAKRFEMSCKIK